MYIYTYVYMCIKSLTVMRAVEVVSEDMYARTSFVNESAKRGGARG